MIRSLVVAASLTACRGHDRRASPPAQWVHREIDRVPVESVPQAPLPPGVLEAGFALNTGGGYGDARSDGSEAIDWAECDGTTYSLRLGEGRVEVRDERSHALVTAIAVPPGLHPLPR